MDCPVEEAVETTVEDENPNLEAIVRSADLDERKLFEAVVVKGMDSD